MLVHVAHYMNSTRHAAHTCLQQPRLMSALCPCALTFYVITTHMAAAIAGLACCVFWLQCDHRVLTATHEFWCNPRRHCCRCPGTGSTWQVMLDSPHMPAVHSLLLQLVLAVAWVQGSQQHSSTHSACGTILIQQYQGVQAHCACSMHVSRRLQQVLLQACAHLFVTATEFSQPTGLFEQS
jgi:hypothetical protein